MVSGSDTILLASIDSGATFASILAPFNLTAVRGYSATQTTEAFIQLFDASAASAITLGTTLPDWVVHVTADGVTEADGLPTTRDGLNISKGLVVAATTTAGGSTGATITVHCALAFV